jgi:hypothetical protein
MKRPALRRRIAMDGTSTWDAQEFKDASGGYSLSEIYENSPALQRAVKEAEAERRRVQDCNRFGSTSKDAATIQTSRKNVTRTGIR